MKIPENNDALVDLSSLTNLLDGNNQGVVEIINLFIEHTPPSILEMKEKLANQEWDELKAKVHSIKSYYGYVGNDALNQRLSDWEEILIQSPQNFDHNELMNELETKTAAIIERLKEILKQGIK